MNTLSFDDFLARQLDDPEFAKVHAELEPQYQLVRDLLDLQAARGISPSDLAARVGVDVEDLYYLEDAGGKLSLSLLYRVAQVLNAHLEVRLLPLETGVSVC
jgi:hypothetical protein